MATGVFFRVCGLASFPGCVLGLEHQFHMGSELLSLEIDGKILRHRRKQLSLHNNPHK